MTGVLLARASRWPPLIGLAIVLAGACGREDVVLPGVSDAGAGEGGGEGSAAESSTDSACPTGANACRANGAGCSSPQECCSNRCEAGFCLSSGVCGATGDSCTARSGCCSGRCEPSGSSLSCRNYCAAFGSHCDTAADCCSLACNADVCDGPICIVAGQSCSRSADCCSNKCENNQCQLDTGSPCRPTGEACDAEGGSVCCSNTCDAVTGRCAFSAAGKCLEPGAPCITDGDCCRGACQAGPSGVPTCTAACLADGANCNTGGDCCGAVCAGAPSTCIPSACVDAGP